MRAVNIIMLLRKAVTKIYIDTEIMSTLNILNNNISFNIVIEAKSLNNNVISACGTL